MLTLTFLSMILHAQQMRIDSLENVLKGNLNDSSRSLTLSYLAHEYSNSDMDRTKALAEKALKLAEKTGYRSGLAYAHTVMGVYYDSKGDFPKATLHFTEALKFSIETGNLKKGCSVSINLGNIFFSQNNIPNARKYYLQALELAEKTNFRPGKINSIHNLAGCYYMEGNLNKCLEYLVQHIQMHREDKNFKELATAYSNLGSLYAEHNKFNEAVRYLDSSVVIHANLRDLHGIASALENKGIMFATRDDHESAVRELKRAYDTAAKVQNRKLMSHILKNMAVSYAKKGDYKNAYDFQLRGFNLNDSIFNDNFSKQINEMQAKYDSEHKDKELMKAETQKKALEADSKQKSMQRNAFIVGFLLMIVLAFFIFRGYRHKQQANLEISIQKNIIQEKNREITDSINYAERIQRSFISAGTVLQDHFPDHFILFLPKDIVSGDFYWTSLLNNGRVVLATADSTGHGVPGSIMSILNITSLENAVKAGSSEPSEILDHTRKSIIERLKADGSREGGKDGMDCSLISIYPGDDKLSYAAANNPVWILRKGEIIVLPADKMPVGKHEKDNVSFTQREFFLEKEDIIYTFSDGIADQFGGTDGKKFMNKKLKDLLLKVKTLPMTEQKEQIHRFISEWKGDREQVDDMILIGIRWC